MIGGIQSYKIVYVSVRMESEDKKNRCASFAHKCQPDNAGYGGSLPGANRHTRPPEGLTDVATPAARTLQHTQPCFHFPSLASLVNCISHPRTSSDGP